jgi:putative thioredoxin
MFGVQGSPAGKAFRDGAVVPEFVGVQPEDAIRPFLDQNAPDLARLEEARKAEAVGAMDEAERLYREAVSANPNDHQAAVGLARVLLEGGADEEARSLLQAVPPDAESRRLLAEMTLRQLAAGAGPMATAAAAAMAGNPRGALDRCLQIIAEGGEDRDAARETMVAIFDMLGGEHPLTREYRPRLASVLF